MGCGCRRGLICCSLCKTIRSDLELEMRHAMDSGRWVHFDVLRRKFEEHMARDVPLSKKYLVDGERVDPQV